MSPGSRTDVSFIVQPVGPTFISGARNGHGSGLGPAGGGMVAVGLFGLEVQNFKAEIIDKVVKALQQLGYKVVVYNKEKDVVFYTDGKADLSTRSAFSFDNENFSDGGFFGQEIIGKKFVVAFGSGADHRGEQLGRGVFGGAGRGSGLSKPVFDFPWISAAGAATGIASHLSANSVGWYSFSQNKFYSNKFYGNQYTAGGQKAAKLNSARLTKLGYGLGLWNAYDVNNSYINNKIGTAQMVIEQGSNLYSTVGGLYGACWGIGWELGRALTSQPWYRENVRPHIQDALGVKPN